VICLGTWEFGQTDQWGAHDVSEYGRVLDRALDAGINFIDTSELYGNSEEILGQLLKGRREKVILATKIAGYQWDYNTMRKRLQQSLKRLQTDYLDLYQIHWPKIKGADHGQCLSNMESEDYSLIASSLGRLKSEGLISMGGVSNFRLRHLRGFNDDAFNIIASDQVPYSLLWRAYDDRETIDFCGLKGVKYLAYSTLAVGLLSGKYGRDTRLAPAQSSNLLFNEPILTYALKVVEVVKGVAKEVDASPAQIALRWVIDREPTCSAIVATTNPENISANVEAVDLHLTRDQSERLDVASKEFWSSMSPALEMWIWRNTSANLEKIGVKL